MTAVTIKKILEVDAPESLFWLSHCERGTSLFESGTLLINSEPVAMFYTWPEFASETTGQVSLILPPSREDQLTGQLQSYVDLPVGWDGYGGRPASKAAVADALAFLEKRPSDIPLPYAQLASDGEVGLYWDSDGVFADVGFYGNGKYSFYAKHTSREGVVTEEGRDHCRVSTEAWHEGLLRILNKLSTGAVESWPALARTLSGSTAQVTASVNITENSSLAALVNLSPLAITPRERWERTSDLFEPYSHRYRSIQTPEMLSLPLLVMRPTEDYR
jgi:hypothetical protein